MNKQSFKQFVETQVPKELEKKLNESNALGVPRVLKVTVGAGIDASTKNQKLQDTIIGTLTRITGQKPVVTKARKSISGFKVRQGMVVGAKVTLRGNRMYDFLQKLIHVTLPRIRDFRGLPTTGIDESGNLSLGFKEHIAFPEIRSDEIELLHGLQVTITTNARTRERGLALFSALGFPFIH